MPTFSSLHFADLFLKNENNRWVQHYQKHKRKNHYIQIYSIATGSDKYANQPGAVPLWMERSLQKK